MKRWLSESFFREVIKGSATLLSGSFGGALLGLATLSITLKTIGVSWYGIYVLSLTYTEIFDQVFNFQSWQALVKLGAKELEKDDSSGFSKFIKISFIFDTLTSLIGTLFAVFLSSVIGNALGWTAVQILLVRCYALWILTHLMGMPTGLMRLLGDFKILARHRVISSFIRLLAVGVSSLIGLEPVFFIMVLIASEVFDNVFLFILGTLRARHHGYGDWFCCKVDRAYVIEFFKFGIWTNIQSTLSIPVKKFDKMIVSHFLGTDILSVYKFFEKFGQIIRKVLSSLIFVIFPQFSKDMAGGKHREAYRNAFRLGLLLIGAGIPFWLIFSFSAQFWVGPLFSSDFVPYIPLLILYIGLNILHAGFIAVDSVLLSSGHVRQRFLINLSSILVYYLVLFMGGFNLGLLGFILAGVMTQLYTDLIKIWVIKRIKPPKELLSTITFV